METIQLEPTKQFERGIKRHMVGIVALIVFFVIWLCMLIEGLFFLKPGDEMGYCVLNFYLVLPLTSLICSIIVGAKKTWLKWLIPFAFGAAGCLLPLFIFGAGSWGIFTLRFAGVPSAVGLGIGMIIYLNKNQLNKKA